MSGEQPLDLLFLGTAGCWAPAHEDTASYLIAGELAVDTGWQLRERLKLFGKQALDIKHLCLTHLHHDHMMGLPGFLYDHYARGDIKALHIYGPEGLLDLVRDACRLLRASYYWPAQGLPTVGTLAPGDHFETPRLRVRAQAQRHPVPALCYRIESKSGGPSLGIGGDGAYQPALSSFFAGCHTLVLEHSLGLSQPADNPGLHASIHDAARLARDSGAHRLCPVHGPVNQQAACQAAARTVFEGEIHWPQSGEQLIIG